MTDHGGSGPRCRNCGATEQRCAYLYGECCESGCTHWRRFDRNGNDAATGTPGRQRQACDYCRRIRRACSHREVAA